MRDRYREHVRAAVLETAHDLIVKRGWERVRMGEIADAVGVSRALLYKEFKDKPGLGEAVVLREAARFIDGIEEVLAHHRADAGRGLAAAVDFTLEEAERSPLLRAVLISNGESLLAVGDRDPAVAHNVSADCSTWRRGRWSTG
ncbi:TetR/AcrR family transcriptional regulator [Nocardioides convexus]|uniref:TetR/AcrR family transcriptional regulator n=1 Tax=Nocardioides convexus TaxID=2712224 RepID=UPI0024181ACB|nr:TetR/AcrR family transcriptional regulator [Nocardioides convexus]